MHGMNPIRLGNLKKRLRTNLTEKSSKKMAEKAWKHLGCVGMTVHLVAQRRDVSPWNAEKIAKGIHRYLVEEQGRQCNCIFFKISDFKFDTYNFWHPSPNSSYLCQWVIDLCTIFSLFTHILNQHIFVSQTSFVLQNWCPEIVAQFVIPFYNSWGGVPKLIGISHLPNIESSFVRTYYGPITRLGIFL